MKIAAIHEKKEDNSSDSSDCDSCSDCSEKESKRKQRSSKTKLFAGDKANEIRKRKRKRANSDSSQHGSDSLTSRSSEDSLQQINEEDLAAILPPEEYPSFDNSNQNISASTKKNHVDSALICDGASSSDMELPSQLVDAAIQQAESCSETEAAKSATASLYSSSLLQEFEAKTQILSNSTAQKQSAVIICNTDKNSSKSKIESQHSEKIVKERDKIESVNNEQKIKHEVNKQLEVKKKRGRPKKIQLIKKLEQNNESPDSGILSNPNSPAIIDKKLKHKPNEKSQKNSDKVIAEKKINISSLERAMYATERVLYPPRNRTNVKRGPGRPPKVKRTRSASPVNRKSELDPVWMKLDLNKKYREPKVSGYKSDYGGMVCSKTLAAQSGYVSDYSGRSRSRSGYRSDHSVKSSKSRCGYKSDYCHSKRSSGYRSDYSTKSRGCGYRTDCSVGRKRIVRKKKRDLDSKRDRMRSKHNIFLEQDIMKLACLSLGQSNDDSNSNDSVISTNIKSTFQKFESEKKNSVTTKSNMNVFKSLLQPKKTLDENLKVNNTPKKTSESFLSDICERVTRSLAETVSSRPVLKPLSPKTNVDNKKNNKSRKIIQGGELKRRSMSFGDLTSLKNQFNKPLAGKNIFAHSLTSKKSVLNKKPLIVSKHKVRKHKHVKTKSHPVQTSKSIETKLNTDIESLIISFVKFCQITSEKEKNDLIKALKRSKKRKLSDGSEVVSIVGSKRRHKKVSVTQSPDEHKLPLKKRHYLLTTSAENRATRHPNTRNQVIHNKDSKEMKDKDREQKEVSKDVKEKEQKSSVQQVSSNVASKSSNSVEIFRTHSDEVRDSCINKNSSSSGANEKGKCASPNQKAVTPKKRQFLETEDVKGAETRAIANNKSTLDLSVSHTIQMKSQQIQEKKSDIVTRKKNRLEGLVSKIQPNSNYNIDSTKLPNSVSRPSVIKNTNQENSKLPPPGVFEPSKEIEIPIATITISSIQNAEAKKSLISLHKEIIDLKENVKASVLSKSLVKDNEKKPIVKKKRRKAINRSGFPTKKRKKKIIVDVNKRNEKNVEIKVNVQTKTDEEKCDRVPQVGEDTTDFIKRSIWPKLSVINIEKLQNSTIEALKLSPKNKTLQRTSIQTRSDSPIDDLEDVVLSKRKLRLKSDSIEQRCKSPRKRIHENSKSAEINEGIKNTTNYPEKNNKKQQSRDNSSDNEPLIKLIKNNRTCTTFNKDEKIEKQEDTKVKQNLVANDISKNVEKTEPDTMTNMRTRSKSVSRNKSVENKSDSLPLQSPKIAIKGRRSRISSMQKVEPLETITNVSEICISIPERPKSQMSQVSSSLPTPPLDCSDAVEQEPLPQQEDSVEFSSRDDSPYNSDSTNQTSSDASIKKKNLKWKKKYLLAGLLSDFYKDDRYFIFYI